MVLENEIMVMYQVPAPVHFNLKSGLSGCIDLNISDKLQTWTKRDEKQVNALCCAKCTSNLNLGDLTQNDHY